MAYSLLCYVYPLRTRGDHLSRKAVVAGAAAAAANRSELGAKAGRPRCHPMRSPLRADVRHGLTRLNCRLAANRLPAPPTRRTFPALPIGWQKMGVQLASTGGWWVARMGNGARY